MHTGWTENIALRKGAHRWVLEVMPIIAQRLPFPVVGIDCDNGGEFIDAALIGWAGHPAADHQVLIIPRAGADGPPTTVGRPETARASL